MNPVEQAHQSLKSVLLTGRILVNGLPLTANELSMILQGEQMLYEKAIQFDKASQAVANAPKAIKKDDKKKE
uniref:Uncharacterized protein n=1 Tax=viral metagenome TaxID=1070528 RepID=A0A6M3J8H2_9ZZZZ